MQIKFRGSVVIVSYRLADNKRFTTVLQRSEYAERILDFMMSAHANTNFMHARPDTRIWLKR